MPTASIRTAVAIATIATAGPASSAAAQQPLSRPDSSGYVGANGIDYWFEIRGKGEPIVLLHGGLMSTEGFGPMLAKLAETRRVIGIDLQGHGHTALGDRQIVPADIGRDLGAVIRKLGIRKTDVLGYSFGGIVAFQLGLQQPELVRHLVLVSAPYARTGWFAEMLPQQASVGAAMAESMKESPMYKSYAAIAPRPQDFPRLLDAMGDLMRRPYDWSANVKELTMPVMLAFGDADMVRPDHIVSFYQLLGGGLKDAGWMRESMSRNRLAILPDLTHYEIGESPALAAAVLPFIDGKTFQGGTQPSPK